MVLEMDANDVPKGKGKEFPPEFVSKLAGQVHSHSKDALERSLSSVVASLRVGEQVSSGSQVAKLLESVKKSQEGDEAAVALLEKGTIATLYCFNIGRVIPKISVS